MVLSVSVSVVVPPPNRAELLAAAVASALDQPGVDVEVLVCDDGATDGSAAVVAAIEDPRVRWLPGPASGGPAVPRNRGVAAARGEWVAFLDSDDRWRSGKLRAQLDRLDQTGGDACVTNAFRCVPGDLSAPGLMHDRLPPLITLDNQLERNLVMTSTVLARTTTLRRLGGFPEKSGRTLFEDYALWLRLAQERPVSVVDEPWVDYRDEAAASVRGTMASELTCTAHALEDFVHWRRQGADPVRTTAREVWVMARQLGRLVAVRDIVRRTLRPVVERNRTA
ncbi:hypothetical protein BH10ACT10_BH10ACT10_02940 [soil metagenome]